MPSLQLEEPTASNTASTKVQQLAWCQTPSFFGDALAIDVCGLSEDSNGENGGVSISIGWREGALKEEAMRKLAGVVKETLRSLTKGEIGEETKVWDLIVIS